MKTSKEMQLRILDKMRENVEDGNMMYDGIECRYDGHNNSWVNAINLYKDNFHSWELRVKPETITINGVEIPRPLSEVYLFNMPKGQLVYSPSPVNSLYQEHTVVSIFQGIKPWCIVYSCQEEAIEASKLLFGIKD